WAFLLLRKILEDADFKRDALGIHDEVSRHEVVITAAEWKKLIDVGPGGDVRPDALGVDMSHGRVISICACWLEGESAHVEEVWAGTDVAAAVDWVTLVAGRRLEVVIDDVSPAAQMIPTLKTRHVNVKRSTA